MDSEKKVKHSALSDEAESDMLDPVIKLGVKLRKEVVDAAYPPIIQSGGVYDLKVNYFLQPTLNNHPHGYHLRL